MVHDSIWPAMMIAGLLILMSIASFAMARHMMKTVRKNKIKNGDSVVSLVKTKDSGDYETISSMKTKVFVLEKGINGDTIQKAVDCLCYVLRNIDADYCQMVIGKSKDWLIDGSVSWTAELLDGLVITGSTTVDGDSFLSLRPDPMNMRYYALFDDDCQCGFVMRADVEPVLMVAGH